MAMSALTLGPALAAAAGSTDPAGLTAWNNIAAALIAHITTNAEVNPLTGTPPMTATTGTGPAPVVGQGRIV